MKKEILARYKNGGIKALEDREIIEIITGKTCETAAVYLREEIDKGNNIKINLFKDIFVKYLEQKLIKQRMICRSSKEVFDYFYVSMRGLAIEEFKIIYLTSKNAVIKAETVFRGSLTSSSIYPREIFKNCINFKAAAVIFAHNHPSGEPEPSDSDKSITKTITMAGHFMEIKVLDHIIIGDNRYFSFADNGLIKEYEIATKTM